VSPCTRRGWIIFRCIASLSGAPQPQPQQHKPCFVATIYISSKIRFFFQQSGSSLSPEKNGCFFCKTCSQHTKTLLSKHITLLLMVKSQTNNSHRPGCIEYSSEEEGEKQEPQTKKTSSKKGILEYDSDFDNIIIIENNSNLKWESRSRSQRFAILKGLKQGLLDEFAKHRIEGDKAMNDFLTSLKM